MAFCGFGMVDSLSTAGDVLARLGEASKNLIDTSMKLSSYSLTHPGADISGLLAQGDALRTNLAEFASRDAINTDEVEAIIAQINNYLIQINSMG